MSIRVLGIALACGMALLACAKKKKPKKRVRRHVAAHKLPAGFKVDLPIARIVKKKPEHPVRYPDGTYSVSGLLNYDKKKEIFGKSVKVSGYVVSMHIPKQSECRKRSCKPPHMYVADAAQPPDDAPQLLVADFEKKQVKKVAKGSRYVFVGNFEIRSTSRFMRTKGLLSFKQVEVQK